VLYVLAVLCVLLMLQRRLPALVLLLPSMLLLIKSTLLHVLQVLPK
jgi:hypothetical protein